MLKLLIKQLLIFEVPLFLAQVYLTPIFFVEISTKQIFDEKDFRHGVFDEKNRCRLLLVFQVFSEWLTNMSVNWKLGLPFDWRIKNIILLNETFEPLVIWKIVAKIGSVLFKSAHMAICHILFQCLFIAIFSLPFQKSKKLRPWGLGARNASVGKKENPKRLSVFE